MQDENASRRAHFSNNFRHAMDAGLGVLLLKLVVGVVIVLSLTGGLKTVLRPIQTLVNGRAANAEPRDGMRPEVSGADTSHTLPAISDEARQSKREADEAAPVL